MSDLSYIQVRPNILMVADHDQRGFATYCTLIKGSRMALLVDTGFGNIDLRGFVESQVTTPYMVVNTHSHPDHVGGNNQFDTVWLAEDEIRNMPVYTNNAPVTHKQNVLTFGQTIDLGDIHVDVVNLGGHTRTCTGYLLREERLLVAGDAFGIGVWLFGPYALTLKEFRQTLLRTLKLEFDTFLYGHNTEEFPKEQLLSHLVHLDNIIVDPATMRLHRDWETYRSVYRGPHGKSVIKFTLDKVD